MKTLLLLLSSTCFMVSCAKPPKEKSKENLTIEEIKARVKAEKVEFEVPSNQLMSKLDSNFY